MSKTAKKPASRQNEFITVAQELFNEKGFENTSVDDIVNRMGVAKGLFYYYFDSKEELLQVIMDRMNDEIESSVTAVMEKKGLTALERFKELMITSSDVASRSAVLISYFHKERNQACHLAMENRSREFMIPVMEKIIVQGVEEGVFKANHPRETAVALMGTFSWIKHLHPNPMSPEEMERLILVFQELAERLLVMEPGTFTAFQELAPPVLKLKTKTSD
jgi:AcrR family transcriptional regulator